MQGKLPVPHTHRETKTQSRAITCVILGEASIVLYCTVVHVVYSCLYRALLYFQFFRISFLSHLNAVYSVHSSCVTQLVAIGIMCFIFHVWPFLTKLCECSSICNIFSIGIIETRKLFNFNEWFFSKSRDTLFGP